MTSKKKLRKREKASRQDGVVETTPTVGLVADARSGGATHSAERGADAATVPGREAAARSAEPDPSGAVDAFGRYNAILVEMVRANVAATGALFAALVQAKSMPEAVVLNADHLCRQIEALTDRGRDLADLTQTLALGALTPFTADVDRCPRPGPLGRRPAVSACRVRT